MDVLKALKAQKTTEHGSEILQDAKWLCDNDPEFMLGPPAVPLEHDRVTGRPQILGNFGCA